jgi:peptidase A4-like protein
MPAFRSCTRVAMFTTILATVGLTAAPAMAEQPSAPSLKSHGPIEVHRLEDGSLARGPRNEFITQNWSGYAIGSYQSGQSYSSASATWVVPTVTFSPTTSGTAEQYSATWVGVGGFCMNALCTRADRTLIQLGTEQDISSSNATSYAAWYEMLPQAPVAIPKVTIHPGDKITASLQCVSPCSANKTQLWQLNLTNITTGDSWNGSFNYRSSLASADWIEEAPVSSTVLPLADFSVVGISPSLNSNTVLTSANAIQMNDPWGQTSNPGSADSTSGSFSLCWGYQSMTSPCPPVVASQQP